MAMLIMINIDFLLKLTGFAKGSWSKRISEFQKYFGTAPCVLTDNISELDKFRTKRNSIGHYIGRDKVRYSTPIDLSPLSVSRLSHDTLLKYFKTNLRRGLRGGFLST